MNDLSLRAWRTAALSRDFGGGSGLVVEKGILDMGRSNVLDLDSDLIDGAVLLMLRLVLASCFLTLRRLRRGDGDSIASCFMVEGIVKRQYWMIVGSGV